MENHFNISTTAALYIQHFNVALINFEKHISEERRYRRLHRNRKNRK